MSEFTYKKRSFGRLCFSDKLFYCLTTAFLAFFMLIVLLPLINIVACSFSGSYAGSAGQVYLLPKKFTLEGYKTVFNYRGIWRAYGMTFFYTIVGTVINLAMTMLCAYPLSQRDLPLKGPVIGLMTFTMFFGGGLIPYYVTIMRLKMIDTFWVMVLPGAISAHNVIVFKTFFMSIPEELRESANLDGAGHVRILFQIVLPLSKAVLATFALFSIVGYWNDYMTALLYLRDDTKYPIQLLMRRLLVLMDYKDASTAQLLKDYSSISSRTTKAAATIITVVPVLCVYPFMQKHFAKGALVGSVKA